MAVKIPTPPTPPAPPAVPGVTLSEGGSVKESNAPPAQGTTSKSTDNEKEMEQQAKAAVVNGSGGLSRTTRTDPAAEAKAAKAAAKEARQTGAEQAKATAETGRSQAAQAANLGAAAGQEEPQAAQQGAAAAKTLQTPEAPPKSLDYQGLTYWVPMLVLGFVLAALVVKKFLHRQGRQGELTQADVSAALGPEESRELRGLTPDEVLARLEAQEKPAAARTQVARAQVKKSYSQTPAPKDKAVPKRPSKASTAPNPKTKARPRPAKDEERQRFEVRV